MAEQNAAGRGALAFILGGVVIAIAALVWYLAATDGNIFSRNTAPSSPSITIELPAAPAAPAAPAD